MEKDYGLARNGNSTSFGLQKDYKKSFLNWGQPNNGQSTSFPQKTSYTSNSPVTASSYPAGVAGNSRTFYTPEDSSYRILGNSVENPIKPPPIGTPKVDPNEWTNSLGNWANVAGLGLKGFEVYNGLEAGNLARESFNLQKEQIGDNRKLTYASALRGWEDQRTQELKNIGVGTEKARAQANSEAPDAVAKYNIRKD